MDSALSVNDHEQVINEHGVCHFQLVLLFKEVLCLFPFQCLYVADSHCLLFSTKV